MSNRATEWTDLIDRIEARLHKLEAAAANPDARVDPGPDPTLENIPMVPPSAFERLRLAAVIPAHRQATENLSNVR